MFKGLCGTNSKENGNKMARTRFGHYKLNPRTGLSTHIIEEKHLIKKRRVLKILTGNTELNVWEASFIAEEHWNKLNNENGNIDPVWSFLFHKWSKPPSLKFNVTENIKRLCENNDEFELPDDILDS